MFRAAAEWVYVFSMQKGYCLIWGWGYNAKSKNSLQLHMRLFVSEICNGKVM